jgi:hypothetical protein
MIYLPAIGTAYAGLSRIWGLPYSDEIPATIVVICTMLGSWLKVSSVAYYKASGSLEMPADEVEVDNTEIGEG